MSLDLALLRGWIPGSIRERGWPADYIANDGQTVSAEDAKNLADALDPERKAAMISNLLVVLVGDREVTPVINTGTLYS